MPVFSLPVFSLFADVTNKNKLKIICATYLDLQCIHRTINSLFEMAGMPVCVVPPAVAHPLQVELKS
jgi:hypothetical protein